VGQRIAQSIDRQSHPIDDLVDGFSKELLVGRQTFNSPELRKQRQNGSDSRGPSAGLVKRLRPSLLRGSADMKLGRAPDP
jgi:hypothetical protein